MLIDELSRRAMGRADDLFTADVEAHAAELDRRIRGARVLVVGGAGSIGASTVKTLAQFRPRTLHVMDQSENNLAELVRDLRSGSTFDVDDFRALPVDLGSSIARRFLDEADGYEHVLNFAAMKHVRSEKDVCSTLQLLDTNVIKAVRFVEWIVELGVTTRYFCVSTDKAANPVNLMGASKRLMEHVLFSDEVLSPGRLAVTSARFANVAFSDGGLLDAFLRRFDKGQPISVPEGTRRYFISLREAGQICMLAAILGPERHVLVPRLHAETHLIDLQTVATEVVRSRGLEPRFYRAEGEAKARVMADLAEGRYPVLLTPLDTSGEKPYEEFVGEGEHAIEVGLQSLLAVPYRPTAAGAVRDAVHELREIIETPRRAIDKATLVALLARAMPELHHAETGRSLDERM